MVTISVNKLILSCDSNAVVYKGSVDYDVYLKFELDSTWTGDVKVNFVSGSTVVTRDLSDDGTVLIPSSVIEPPYFSVSIFTSELSSNAISIRVKQSFSGCGCSNNVTQEADQKETYSDIEKLVKSIVADNRSEMMSVISKNNAAMSQDIAKLSDDVDAKLAALREDMSSSSDQLDDKIDDLRAVVDANKQDILANATMISTLSKSLDAARGELSSKDDELSAAISVVSDFSKATQSELTQLSAVVESNRKQCDENLKTATAIAKGRSTGYVFDTEEELNNWLSVSENTDKLVLGDNLYIRDVGVPDRWWDGSASYQLETQKVDLSPYKPYEDLKKEFATIASVTEVSGEIEYLRDYIDMKDQESKQRDDEIGSYINKLRSWFASWVTTDLVSGITSSLSVKLLYPVNVAKYALTVDGTTITDITAITQPLRVSTQTMQSSTCGINFYTEDGVLMYTTKCETTITNGGICLVKE